MHIGRWLLRSSNIFFTTIIFFHDFIFHESEIRTVLLEVSIDLGLLKKSLLKTSKNVLMYSNSLARHFSSMFHAKCLPPRLDRLLLLRSCLQNFYQWWQLKKSKSLVPFWSYQLYSSANLANLANLAQFWGKWAGLAVLFSW